jgi:hypothetical protein
MATAAHARSDPDASDSLTDTRLLCGRSMNIIWFVICSSEYCTSTSRKGFAVFKQHNSYCCTNMYQRLQFEAVNTAELLTATCELRVAQMLEM